MRFAEVDAGTAQIIKDRKDELGLGDFQESVVRRKPLFLAAGRESRIVFSPRKS